MSGQDQKPIPKSVKFIHGGLAGIYKLDHIPKNSIQ